jgi:hypothetical protein
VHFRAVDLVAASQIILRAGGGVNDLRAILRLAGARVWRYPQTTARSAWRVHPSYDRVEPLGSCNGADRSDDPETGRRGGGSAAGLAQAFDAGNAPQIKRTFGLLYSRSVPIRRLGSCEIGREDHDEWRDTKPSTQEAAI